MRARDPPGASARPSGRRFAVPLAWDKLSINPLLVIVNTFISYW